MERESAVREILQSIGPLFPEDAAKARAARKEALAKSAEAPVESEVPAMTAAPKPMLASQIDNAEKTEVASLAEVLRRLAPSPSPTSVRDAVPELVRPSAPDAFALRAALILRGTDAEPAPSDAVDPEAVPTPLDVVEPVAPEAIPAFTELPAEPAIEATVEETLVETEDVVFVEPSPAEIQAALAAAIEAQRDPAEKVEATPSPTPEPIPPTVDASEDEHDAFAYAIADAILPARPYPPAKTSAAPVAPVAEPEPVAAVVPPVAEPTPSPTVMAVEAPVAAQPKPKFKRARPRKDAGLKKPVEVKKPAEVKKPTVEVKKPAEAKAQEPAGAPVESAPVPAVSTEDDELIRQIRVHREDMIDVDDQIARIDQEIAAEQQAMAHYMSLVEQKHAQRSRLVRLRANTQRFVDTLQLKAEPLKRPAKAEKKSA